MALFLLVVSWGRAWSSSQVDSLPSKFWAARKGVTVYMWLVWLKLPMGKLVSDCVSTTWQTVTPMLLKARHKVTTEIPRGHS